MPEIPPELLETTAPAVFGDPSVSKGFATQLAERAQQRLSRVAGALGLLLLVALVVNLAFGVALNVVLIADTSDRMGLATHVALIPLCLGFAGLVAQRGLQARTVLASAIAFEIVVAFGLALPPFFSLGRHEATPLTWLTVWLVFFPLVAPCATRRAVVGSAIAAASPLLAYALGRWWGEPAATTPMLARVLIDNLMAASLGIVTARIGFALEQEVHQAKSALAELGSYRLIDRLSSGGMGEVWRAEHRMLARPAAVKLILPELIGGRDTEQAKTAMARFEREAKLTAALESPHAVELYDYGVGEDGSLYYVMELLDGLDLENMVTLYGPMQPERVIYLLIQAASSLAEAHAVGLIHRDVKPANLICCRVGLDYDFLKVVDFGLATCQACSQASGLTDDTRLTGEGFIVGTPAYMSPEAAVGKADLDGRADVYALGCVGYWLVTGKVVFEGNVASDVILAHVRDEPIPPSKRVDAPVPADLEQVILACLAKEPQDRPDALDLIERLRGCKQAGAWDEVRARGWWETHQPTAGREGQDTERTRAVLLRSTLPMGSPQS